MENSRAHFFHEPRPLLSVLLATASSNCSDLRDKVFGVLSLAQERSLRRDEPLLQPAYHLGTAEVYWRFALWRIHVKKSLDFLACGAVQDESTLKELEAITIMATSSGQCLDTRPHQILEILDSHDENGRPLSCC
jgi:hypothetical protein